MQRRLRRKCSRDNGIGVRVRVMQQRLPRKCSGDCDVNAAETTS